MSQQLQSGLDISRIFEEWIVEIYEEYDEKVGISEDEKSNISVRRRNLRRGLNKKLEFFYETYDNYLTQSHEKTEELKLIDDLINNVIQDLTLATNDSVFGYNTPDLIEPKYEEIKLIQFNIFLTRLSEISFKYIDQDIIDGKKEMLEEKFNECESEYLEKKNQVSKKSQYYNCTILFFYSIEIEI